MESADQSPSLNGMHAAYLEDVTPGGFGSAGHGFTPWFEDKQKAEKYVTNLKMEYASYEEDAEEDDDEEDDDAADDDASEEGEVDSTLQVKWLGSFQELCADMGGQAQIVRLRFYEDLESSLIKRHFGAQKTDLVSTTPPMPDGLRNDFSTWLKDGALEFGC